MDKLGTHNIELLHQNVLNILHTSYLLKNFYLNWVKRKTKFLFFTEENLEFTYDEFFIMSIKKISYIIIKK